MSYALQICLGLESCDAKMCMMEKLPNADQHDNFPEHFLIGSPHEKLRVCMTKMAAAFVGYAIQISWECKASITSSNFPDPDIFACDMSYRRSATATTGRRSGKSGSA